MIRYYLYLLLAVVCLSLQFVMNKVFQSKNGSGIHTSLLYTTVTGLLTSAIFFALNGFRMDVTPFSFVCATSIALLCTTYNLIGFRIFSLGDFASFTMFLMLGGMMLPFFYGMVFLGEAAELSPLALTLRMCAMVLLVVSMVLPAVKRKSDGASGGKKALFFTLCICVFFCNGGTSVFSKLHQIEKTRPVIDANSFVCLCNLMSGVSGGLVLSAVCGKTKRLPRLAEGFSVSKLLLVAAAFAVFNGVSYLFQLKAAASPLPASVQFPIMTGGSIILTALAGRLFFHEKPDKWQSVGILLSFAATFLFLF